MLLCVFNKYKHLIAEINSPLFLSPSCESTEACVDMETQYTSSRGKSVLLSPHDELSGGGGVGGEKV